MQNWTLKSDLYMNIKANFIDIIHKQTAPPLQMIVISFVNTNPDHYLKRHLHGQDKMQMKS
jgi:hypothetical protein